MSGPRIVLPDYPPVPVSPEAKQRIRDRKRVWEEQQAEIRKRCPGWYSSPPRSLTGMKPDLVYVVGGIASTLLASSSSFSAQAATTSMRGQSEWERNAQLILDGPVELCPQCYPDVLVVSDWTARRRSCGCEIG